MADLVFKDLRETTTPKAFLLAARRLKDVLPTSTEGVASLHKTLSEIGMLKINEFRLYHDVTKFRTNLDKLLSTLSIHPCSFDGCSKTYTNSKNLKLHVRLNLISENIVLFISVQIDRVHLKLKPFVCRHENCDKAFYRKYELTNHITRHIGIKKFTCTDCDRAFTDSSNLANHRKVHSKFFLCTVTVGEGVCSESFPSRFLLDKHKRQSHADYINQNGIVEHTVVDPKSPENDELRRNLSQGGNQLPGQSSLQIMYPAPARGAVPTLQIKAVTLREKCLLADFDVWRSRLVSAMEEFERLQRQLAATDAYTAERLYAQFENSHSKLMAEAPWESKCPQLPLEPNIFQEFVGPDIFEEEDAGFLNDDLWAGYLPLSESYAEEMGESSRNPGQKKRSNSGGPKRGALAAGERMPKRNWNSYMFFCKEKRPELMAANPEFKPTDVGRELGRLWRSMGEEEKKASLTHLLPKLPFDKYNTEICCYCKIR
jgi:hypothetical protein